MAGLLIYTNLTNNIINYQILSNNFFYLKLFNLTNNIIKLFPIKMFLYIELFVSNAF